MIKVRVLYLVITAIVAAALAMTGIFVGIYLDVNHHPNEDIEIIKFFTGVVEGIGLTCMLIFIICRKQIIP